MSSNFSNLVTVLTVSLWLCASVHSLPQRRQSSTYTAQKPVLGYNTYNAVACSPTQQFSEAQIDALESQGYLAAGYNIFQVDCGWQARDGSRNSTTGAINVDLNAFPGGLGAVSSYATQRGFHFGTYSDAGVRACDTTVPSPVAGSLNHEQADAQFFQSINSSYVKYDNCYPDNADASDNANKTPRTDFVSRFSQMTTALRNVGIEAQLTCQWGVPYQSSSSGALQGPVDWTNQIGTSFRLSDDIADDWNDVVRIYNQAAYIAMTDKTGPGFHGDADLLEVGNSGLSFAQQQTHFAYWAMVKSALVISTDLTQASDETKSLLQNAGLISINQDDLGKPVKLIQRFNGDHDLHAGPLSNGDLAVLAVNWQSSTRSLTISFSSLNVSSCDVENLFTGETQTGVSSYTASVASDGSIPLRLSNIVASNADAPSITWYEAESGSVMGNAAVASCSGCSGGKKVGNIGGSGNTLTLSNVNAPSTTSTLLFDYINCAVSYLGGDGLMNQRTATITVNGRGSTVTFPLSGYNWDADLWHNYRVELSGFNVGSDNTVLISAADGAYAPDIDRIGVSSS